ncbi:nucleoside hydrolase [Bacillus sp. FJAT-27225]|uniref:nucleoside hydrolase n=1 Tax=Bacillus sp. FJAT-27225 TaxID=1743144 RepID=UPI00080C33CB|nr:nucleoside hydrolase [Bacillus sp. FJAT-27225]OCA90506.1 nucleoside hydrolase [Bacillus sp. FJAT-27225]
MKKKILLFCDPGIDDSIAIIYILLNPNLELVGIVTSYGNVTKQKATANAYYLLQIANQTHIPVISGAATSVEPDQDVYYPEIHGSEGLGPILPPFGLAFQTHHFDTVRQIINRYQGDLNIVDTGRSTALATAFTLFDEDIKKVGAFYVMGGAFFVPGNVTPLVKANFFGDPTSSNYVVRSAHNLTITPLNVTQTAFITREMVQYILQNSKSPFTFLVQPIYEYYREAYKKNIPSGRGAPVHDLLTVMIVNDPSLCEYISSDVKVIDDAGEAHGLSYIDIRPTSQGGKTKIAIKLDYTRFVQDFLKIMVRPL